jgi:hypothetical protein
VRNSILLLTALLAADLASILGAGAMSEWPFTERDFGIGNDLRMDCTY